MDRPCAGIPQHHADHVKLMLDILVLALWTDTKRIATFMFGNAQSGMDYSFQPGVHGNFHGKSHHLNEPEKMEEYARIIDWHTQQLACFLGRVKGIDEGGTSLLDNSMFLFGSSIKDGNRHEAENLPLILGGPREGNAAPGAACPRREEYPALQSPPHHAEPHEHHGKIFRRQHRTIPGA